MARGPGRLVRLRVKRFSEDRGFYYQEYEVEVDRYSTVLDALLKVIESRDPSLAVRYSCRMGICGSCGMVINGAPRLACETNVLALGGDTVTVEPMYNIRVLRDLVTDMEEFFENHRRVKPYLIRRDREEQFRAEKEYMQGPEELDDYLAFSYCIMCGLCVAACPVVSEKPWFMGPQSLAQAYRWAADSRDEGFDERLEAVDSYEGVWSCEFAGSCSKACPKGVEPALAIQALKTAIMRRRVLRL